MDVWRARDIAAEEEASQAVAEQSTCDNIAADKSKK